MPWRPLLSLTLLLAAALPFQAAWGGQIIYTVGDQDSGTVPPVLESLRGAGWTITVNRVPVDFTQEQRLGADLFRQSREAHMAGNTPIILAGRSFGAWISLVANSSWSTPVEGGHALAVIAFDAGVSSESRRVGTRWHDYKFMDVIKTQDPARLAIILFDEDAESGQIREDEVRRVIRRPAIPHLVAYEPAPLAGPGGLDSEDFARRWRPCLATLLSIAPPPDQRPAMIDAAGCIGR